jgi:hypothetical protein
MVKNVQHPCRINPSSRRNDQFAHFALGNIQGTFVQVTYVAGRLAAH